MSRFHHQLNLKNFGIINQQKLQNSHVLVIGAGGLGCPALMYLAAAGIGNIGVVDFDNVELSNLNRQVLFGIQDIGKFKSVTASNKLSEQYNDIQIHSFVDKISQETIQFIASNYDYILDCTDNLETRYIISDYCKAEKKTLIMGAVFEYEGQVFRFSDHEGNYYRDIFPKSPSANEIPPCSINGIIGVLTGIIGTILASEIIKSIVSDGTHNIMISYNLKNNYLSEIQL